MATHTITVEEKKELNDSQVAYRLRCDGDPTTDSWHTWDLTTTTTTFAAFMAAQQQRIAALYEAKLAWRSAAAPAAATVTV